MEGAMAEPILTAGEIFGRLGELLRENAVLAAGCVVGLTAINIGLDAVSTGNGMTLPAGLISLGAQYYLTATVLEKRGLREPGSRNRFGAFWRLNIVSGLGLLLGYLLLILPGLYLSARWMVASPALLAEDSGVGAALGESWAITKPSLWAILGTLLVIFIPIFVVGAGLSIAFETWLPVLAAPILYVFLFSAVTLSWLASVAAYSLLRPGSDHLAEVFA
jgi:hypothetical protein